MLLIKVTYFENHWLSQLEHLCQSLEEEHGGQGELECNAIRKYIKQFLLLKDERFEKEYLKHK